MKGLLLGLVLLVLFVHFGGPNVPKVLKDNKQMVYGVTIGLVLCSFFGVNVEGAVTNQNDLKECLLGKCNSPSPSPPLYCECSPYIDIYLSVSNDKIDVDNDKIDVDNCSSPNIMGSITKQSLKCMDYDLDPTLMNNYNPPT